MTYVLVHGGGFSSSVWDLLAPLLRQRTVELDLPGRGAREADLASVGLGDFVDAVVEDVVDGDLREVVLVGHSLAGITLPGVADRISHRLRHLVFISCMVPADGTRVVDSLPPEVRSLVPDPDVHRGAAPGTLGADVARALFCNDMDEDHARFTLERMVPEAPEVIYEKVSLAGLRQGTPRTYVRLTRDAVLPPAQQDRMIANLGGARVTELDSGHMAMISQPHPLAAVLNAL